MKYDGYFVRSTGHSDKIFDSIFEYLKKYGRRGASAIVLERKK